MKFSGVEVIGKPWGREIIIASEKEYIGKIIEVDKGARLSHQYHEKKKETMYVLSGRMKLVHGEGEKTLDTGDTVTLDPGDTHRIEALEDLRIIEVSTFHPDDVIRIADDYGRSSP
ncbi:cupin domain-containing protein [Candidatus Altiarchaeota archaeon]